MDINEFERGLVIYKACGGSAVLIRMFEKFGATPFNVGKLEEVLGVSKVKGSKLHDKGEDCFVPRNPSVRENTIERGFLDRMRPLFQEASFLHSKKLGEDVSIEERRNAAFRIMEIHEDELPLIYKERDYYREHGKVMEVCAEVKPGYESDPVKMVKRMTNLRSYISKYKNKADRADDVRAWMDEVAYYEVVLK